MKKVIISLQQMTNELTRHPDISDVHQNHSTAASFVVDLILTEFTELTKEDIQSFVVCDQLEFKWSIEDEKNQGIFGGESNIPGLLDLFFTNGENIYWHSEINYDQRFDTFTKKLIPLDRFWNAYDGSRSVAIQLNNEQIGVERLWYWNDEGDKYPLSIALEDYLVTLILNKGIVNWPLFYIDFETINFRDEHAREWLYGATTKDYKDEMKVVLSIAEKIDPELYKRLNERYKKTVIQFKQFR